MVERPRAGRQSAPWRYPIDGLDYGRYRQLFPVGSRLKCDIKDSALLRVDSLVVLEDINVAAEPVSSMEPVRKSWLCRGFIDWAVARQTMGLRTPPGNLQFNDARRSLTCDDKIQYTALRECNNLKHRTGSTWGLGDVSAAHSAYKYGKKLSTSVMLPHKRDKSTSEMKTTSNVINRARIYSSASFA